MVMVLTPVVVVVMVVVVAHLSRQNNSKRHQHPYIQIYDGQALRKISIVRSYFVCRGFDRLKGGT